MDIREIQDLIKFVSKSGVNEVSLETKDFKLTVKTDLPGKEKKETVVYTSIPQVEQHPAPQVVSVPQQSASPAPAAPKNDDAKVDANLVAVKSPMIGTFYRSSGPDKPIFANVGDEIKPGKVLCIIEAMKLFNEIESEVSGRIVKVLVEDASPVEYDQVLFLVEPA